MASQNGIERQLHQAELIGPAELWAQPWTLALRNIDSTINLIDVEPTTSVLTPNAVDKIRGYLYDHASKNWKLRLLLYLSVIEVGVATVEAVLPKPTHIEVIVDHYSGCPFLTAAFSQPSILPSLSSPDFHQREDISIRLLQHESVTVGSKVIIIRAVYEKLQKAFELCAIGMIALFVGILAGLIARKVDVGIAVTAAWLQFAQLFQTCRWLYT